MANKPRGFDDHQRPALTEIDCDRHQGDGLKSAPGREDTRRGRTFVKITVTAATNSDRKPGVGGTIAGSLWVSQSSSETLLWNSCLSASVALSEVEDQVRQLAELGVAPRQLVGDVYGHVTSAAFIGIEDNDARRLVDRR